MRHTSLGVSRLDQRRRDGRLDQRRSNRRPLNATSLEQRLSNRGARWATPCSGGAFDRPEGRLRDAILLPLFFILVLAVPVLGSGSLPAVSAEPKELQPRVTATLEKWGVEDEVELPAESGERSALAAALVAVQSSATTRNSLRLGAHFQRIGALAAATHLYEQARRSAESHHDRRQTGRAYFALATVAHERGELDRADALYTKARERFPQHPLLLRSHAVLAELRGETASAWRRWARLAKLCPEDPAPWSARAELAWRDDDHDTAARHVRDALRRDPSDRHAHRIAGRLAYATGDLERARHHAFRARPHELARDLCDLRTQPWSAELEVECDTVDARLRRALVAIDDGDQHAAAAELGAIARRDPSPLNYRRWSSALLAADRGSAARQVARRSVALHPGEPTALLALAETVLDQEPRVAEKALRSAIDAEPTLARAHYWLAILSHDGGRPDDAIAASDEAVRLGPEAWEHHWLQAQLWLERARLDERSERHQQAMEAREHAHVAIETMRRLAPDAGDRGLGSGGSLMGLPGGAIGFPPRP